MVSLGGKVQSRQTWRKITNRCMRKASKEGGVSTKKKSLFVEQKKGAPAVSKGKGGKERFKSGEGTAGRVPAPRSSIWPLEKGVRGRARERKKRVLYC